MKLGPDNMLVFLAHLKVFEHTAKKLWSRNASLLKGFISIFCRSGNFPILCNKESVTLRPVCKTIDVTFIKEQLKNFVELTGSEVASRILANWEEEVKYFVKVSFLPYFGFGLRNICRVLCQLQ